MGSATRHLMIDALWRGRMAWCLASVFLLGAWALVAVGFVSAKAGMAASLIGVFTVGPVTALSSLMVRETRFLPITSRDVWVAAWLLSTVVAPVFVLALQAAGFSIGLAFGYPQPNAVQSLAFVTVCTFAYGGVMLPVGPLMGSTSHAASERRPKWLWASIATVVFIAYFGGLLVPWAAWSVLPTSFSHLGWVSSTVLTLGIVAAFGALAWTPQRFGGLGHPAAAASTHTSGTRRNQTGAQPVVRLADRLTGFNRLLVPTLIWAFGIAVGGVLGLAWYFTYFEPWQSLYESFAASGLLPFSAAGLSPKVIMGTALFAPFFAIASNIAWDGHTRHLRVLPMSAADTTRLMIATTMLLWGVVWVVLLGIHVTLLGLRPETLRPELFIYLAGLSALVEAASRYGKKAGRPFSLAAVPVFFLVVGADGSIWRLGVPVMFWTYAAVGATALLTAALLTYRSLTRSTSSAGVYQSSTPSLNAH